MATQVLYTIFIDYIYAAVLTTVGVGGIADSQMRSLEADVKELGAETKKAEEALEKFAKLKPDMSKVQALEEFEKLKPDIGTLEDRLSALAEHALALENSLEGFS